ncbi:hypothetical protein F5X98DRAFT_381661 [Xylaria grammica]|nr:hypothetical protein F5X98DRAFT_381661 [Xylaria grammica]
MQYEALAQQIESVLDDPRPASAQIKDDQLRRRLAESARKLGIFLEEPRHTMRRLGHVHFRLPLLVISLDVGLFATLAAESRAFTSAELSVKTGISLSLLRTCFLL